MRKATVTTESAARLAEWLRCPRCARPLRVWPPLTLTCAVGHSFDCNKRGYLNSLTAPSRFIGDDASMLDARARILNAGTFEPIARTIDELVPNQSAGRVVDFGCGTGYYLAAILRQRPLWSALAVDLSPRAVARATSSAPHVVGLVADLWRPLPIRDGTAGLALNVFAPHNPGDFHRILQPGGALIVVTPRPQHLRELQALGIALTIPTGKSDRLTESLHGLFTLAERRPVTFSIELSADSLTDVVAMGPSAHHSDQLNAPSSAEVPAATVSVDVLRFTRS